MRSRVHHLIMKRLLFLDFDGVLHPDAVYRTRRGVELRAEGKLFMWAPRLVEALAEHPDVSIVLSTSWVRNIGFQRARKALQLGCISGSSAQRGTQPCPEVRPTT